GKINLSYVQDEQDQAGTINNDNWELKTAASRIGFKGSEELSENLKVIYKLEYQIYPDGTDDNEFKGRNSYVGLQGGLGTIIIGQHDTPLKMSSKPVDVFNDYHYGDIAYSIVGEHRGDNIVIYKTPKVGNLAATIAIMPGEEGGTNSGDNDGFADHISAALTYKADNFHAALAMDDNVNGLDTLRLSGSYKLGNLKLGVLMQESEVADGGSIEGKGAIKDALSTSTLTNVDEQDSFVISAAYAVDKWLLKAQIAEATTEGSNGELDNSAISIGVDYKLSKRTKLYSYYSELTVDSDASIGINEDYEYTAMGLVGIEHKF
ncbi:porin, partial [uncultured Oceanicoccus sp.]|uniref:porin n=1 Tax=uncultured Oceanicoccus sp. TaxID=1706381 RepID=UPI0030D72A25